MAENFSTTYRTVPSGESGGSAKFIDVQDLTTPGIEQTLITQLIPAGKLYNILQVTVVCRQEGAFKVLIDSDIIASGRTGAAQSNVSFSFRPYRVANEGETLELKFTGIAGKPSVDIEAYLQAREVTT